MDHDPTLACWCGPTITTRPRIDGTFVHYYTHNDPPDREFRESDYPDPEGVPPRRST